ncbi:Asp-tRNA(Asn)/Glu-tRNA(Gln) amidotransferase subunit GatB [Marinospirillum insulare]|uniref:Aspartyl/glutamyl-tRNA(Asn/Gln) amidotransferase subunit B n=1 Tax=Marinospirillum insulare TaxID=217169 RepID=A0ABQ5ZZC6_9GAMM|nr:Asp-tRNA(Asn)/Glu-tRNA(Gln) amidotransferase subunit GatB [Marinospirillum insulare]GLR64742.1 aspartyl/glutamyl-tRNA(Asn/Gln) amidotransferase subunit B [Marinospirillum insulare]
MQWEAVIGLEIHTQLATKTKIFSGSSTAFGAEPNSQASIIDLAMPGTLPVLNKQALEMAIQFGLAINSEIPKITTFDRKNYFYPDLPKGYQTTQMEAPIVGRGYLDIALETGGTKRVTVHHAHLEEDAGKSLHEDFHGMTGVDLNRAGTPLIEIVTEPEMSSAKEAVAFLKSIHSIITYLGISDGNMAEGSMRCDANVSVRPKGQEKLGNRCEIKNVNSFRFVEKAINYEIQRQIEILEDGGRIAQQTRLYDPDLDETRAMRSKEDANDYRYFPCPDLLPLEVDPAFVQKLKDELPELPEQKRQRFTEQLGLSEYDAGVLSSSRPLADYFDKVVELCKDAQLASNWISGELAAQLNRDGIEITQAEVTPEQFAGILIRLKDDTLSNGAAKKVFAALWAKEGQTADEIIEAKGLKQVTDTGAIEALVDEVLAKNTPQVEQYRAAEPDKRGKMVGFFVGQIMRASKGTANPKAVNELLAKKLDG